MPSFNWVAILSLGVIGLGFLLAFLAYRLLDKAQEAIYLDESIIKNIRSYMTFSVIIVILGLASEAARHIMTIYHSPDYATKSDIIAISDQLLEAQEARDGLRELIEQSSLDQQDALDNFNDDLQQINEMANYLRQRVDRAYDRLGGIENDFRSWRRRILEESNFQE